MNYLKMSAGVLGICMLLSVSGCKEEAIDSTDEVVRVDHNIPERTISKEVTNEKIPVPYEMTYVKSISGYAGKIYIAGYVNGSELINLTRLVDIKTGKISNISLSELTYTYIEKMLLMDNKVYIIYENGSEKNICAVDINSGKVISQQKFESSSSVISFSCTDDGNIFTVYRQFEDQAESYICSIFDGNSLEKIQSANLTEKQIIADDEYQIKIIGCGDGSFYYISEHYGNGEVPNEIRVRKFDSKFEEQYSTAVESENGYYLDGANISGDGQLCVTASSVESADCIVYKVSDGGFSESLIINDEINHSGILDFSMPGYLFLCAAEDGIYGYNDNGAIKKVIDFNDEEYEDRFSYCMRISADKNNIILGVDYFAGGDRVVILDTDGNTENTVELPVHKNGSISDAKVIADGSICVIEEIYEYSVDDNGEYENNEHYYIKNMDINGKVISEITADDMLGSDSAYITKISGADDENIYILKNSYADDGAVSGSVHALKFDGSSVKHADNGGKIPYISCAAVNSYTNYAIYNDKEGKGYLGEINFDNGTFSEIKVNGADISKVSVMCSGNGKYNLYVADTEYLYGYISENQTAEKICPLSEYGIGSITGMFSPDGQDKVVIVAYSDDSTSMDIYTVDTSYVR